MQLGEADIREFTRLWREEFGESLSPEAARAAATALLDLYELLLGANSPAEPPPAASP